MPRQIEVVGVKPVAVAKIAHRRHRISRLRSTRRSCNIMVIGIFAHSDGFFQNPILQGAREAARRYNANLLIYRSPTMSNYSGLDSATIQSQYKVDRSEIDGLIMSYAAPGLIQFGHSLF